MTYSGKRKIYIAISMLLLFTVMAAIFILSSQNADESSKTSGGFVEWIQNALNLNIPEDIIRTLAHFTEFASLGFLVSNLYFALKNKAKILLCILFSWLYAWTDEIHQIFVDGRAFQLIDLTVDLCGIILGVYLFFPIIKVIEAKKHRSQN